MEGNKMTEYVSLPTPDYKGGISLYQAINKRRSIREFTSEHLDLYQVSQLVFSAQGKNHQKFRTIPSAGATFPLDLYILIAENGVENVEAGIYHYLVEDHVLIQHRKGDLRSELFDACYNQTCVSDAPISIILTGEFSRTSREYGSIAIRYVNQEIGHAGQNISLVAVSCGLGSVMVGYFKEDETKRILNCPDTFIPLYIIPVGYPR
jgi:SagB-type dehydrogenase family enzyme